MAIDDIVSILRQGRRRGDAINGYTIEVPADVIDLVIKRLKQKTLKRARGAEPA